MRVNSRENYNGKASLPIIISSLISMFSFNLYCFFEFQVPTKN